MAAWPLLALLGARFQRKNPKKQDGGARESTKGHELDTIKAGGGAEAGVEVIKIGGVVYVPVTTGHLPPPSAGSKTAAPKTPREAALERMRQRERQRRTEQPATATASLKTTLLPGGGFG